MRIRRKNSSFIVMHVRKIPTGKFSIKFKFKLLNFSSRNLVAKERYTKFKIQCWTVQKIKML